MVKQVTIKRLALVNFKGLRNVAVDFKGSVTTIAGRNGIGKTSIVDGFNWVLWGKDSDGNSDTTFGIKTNDANGRFIPHLDHEGSVTLEVTDTETGETETKVFRRVLQEEWKETADPETGETTERLKGHHTNYYFNDMPLKTKGEYDQQVAAVCPEKVFKVITNPRYFLTLNWKTQRTMLLEMAGTISDEQVMATDKKFAKLEALLKGKTLEGFKDQLKENRALVEADLKKIPTRIDEVTRNTPAPVDFTELEKQLASLQGDYNKVDAAMTSKSEENRLLYEGKQALQNQINDLKTKQANVLFAARQKAQTAAFEKNRRHDEAERMASDLKSRLNSLKSSFLSEQRMTQAQIEISEGKVKSLTQQQDEVREKWYSVNAEEYPETPQLICPLFKHACSDTGAVQQYCTDKAAAREKFMTTKEGRLAAITEQGKKLGELIKAEQQAIETAKAKLAELESRHAQQEDDLKIKIQQAQATADASPVVSTQPNIEPSSIPEWQTAQGTIDELTKQISAQPSTADDNTAALRQQRAAIQAQIDAVKAQLQTKAQIQAAAKRIDELNEQKKALQQQKAQLQGKEDLVAAFEKAKMDEVERRVNTLFQYVSFKMYRTQIEDAKEVPDCVAYLDGVRYMDANNAKKINGGLDVINALCAFHKVNAPIFIDNAESVNTFIPTASQLIKLVVTTGDLEISNI